MLTKVEVRNDQGLLLTLPLTDISEGFVVKGVDGLDPVKATITYSSYARLDGSQYQSSRRENRNLIFKIGFEPIYGSSTAQSLRTRLYQWFMTKQHVYLRFFEDTGLTVDIDGRVESNDSPRFSRDPDSTVSIMCFDSDFRDVDLTTISGNTTSGTTELTHEYAGTVDSGFLFKLMLDRTLGSFTIFHKPADDTVRQLNFVGAMVSGDVIEINTQDRQKGAWLTRAGVRTSVLYSVSPESDWINLFPGTNKLRVLATGAAIPWTIDYTAKYGGL